MTSDTFILVTFGLVMAAWALAFMLKSDASNADVLDLAPAPRWSIGKMALIAVVIGVVGAGGYFGNRYMTCQGLQEDYLNSVSSVKSSAVSASAFAKGDVTEALALIRDQQMKSAETALRGLYDQCGNRAAETAARKGTEILLP